MLQFITLRKFEIISLYLKVTVTQTKLFFLVKIDTISNTPNKCHQIVAIQLFVYF